MDRRPRSLRRFLPAPEAMEGRLLMAGATAAAATEPRPATPAQTAQANRQTAAATTTTPTRQLRIEQLPNALFFVNTRRNLPRDVVADIQADLRTIENTLGRASPTVLREFYKDLRNTMRIKTISREHAQVLNVRFGQIINSAGVDPETVARFQANANRLIRADVEGPLPAIVAANDYAVLTQFVLAIGRNLTGTQAVPQGQAQATRNAATSPSLLQGTNNLSGF